MLFSSLFTGQWHALACMLPAFVEMAKPSGKEWLRSLAPTPAFAFSKPGIEMPKPGIGLSMRRIENAGRWVV